MDHYSAMGLCREPCIYRNTEFGIKFFDNKIIFKNFQIIIAVNAGGSNCAMVYLDVQIITQHEAVPRST